MDKISNYWENFEPNKREKTCPNVSFFRFLGGFIKSLNGKKILEVGFNNGADLYECHKRGAEVYGIDLNPNAVSSIDFIEKSKIQISRSGVDNIPFNVIFDVIYTRDTICYLNEKEVSFFFEDIENRLNKNGILIVQYPEQDLIIKKNDVRADINFDLFKNSTKVQIAQNNPYRFISAGELIDSAAIYNLKVFASKRMIQSFDLYEKEFRVDRYLAFKFK